MLVFQPITIADRERIESYTLPLHMECSEFSFINLIIWGQNDKIKWSATDDALYIRVKYSADSPVFFFPPVPRDIAGCDYNALVQVAAAHMQSEGVAVKFRSVSGVLEKLFRECCPDYTFKLDRNTCDYFYRAEDLITLRGKKLHSKRNHINRFRATTEFEYKPLHSENAGECLALYQSWLENRDMGVPGILGEQMALEFMLPRLDELKLLCGGIYVDGQLMAFSVGERIHSDMAIIHIEKASHLFPELYAVINQQFAEHAFSDVVYINREEDMGLEGMRKAKLSYAPIKLIEKYDAVPSA